MKYECNHLIKTGLNFLRVFLNFFFIQAPENYIKNYFFKDKES